MKQTQVIMQASRIQKIVIAGSGLAAWAAAAAIGHALQGQRVRISVAGDRLQANNRVEPGLPISHVFHRRLGIDERQLMRESGASFSLGTRFNGWSEPGNDYFLPLAPHGASIEYVHFHQFAIKARQAGDTTRLNDYSLCALAAERGKFAHPVMDPESIYSTIVYGHHYDRNAYVNTMRNYAQAHGAAEVTGTVTGVQRHPESGFIQSVSLADGTTLDGDFFVDASGPEAILAGEASEFEDCSEWLPVNRLMTGVAPAAHPGPFAEVTAHERYWHQRIPARGVEMHRVAYSDRHLDDEAARAALLASAGTTELVDTRPGPLHQARRKNPWTGNCIALGAAAGVLEPLAGTRLALIHSGLLRLLAMFPDTDCNPLLAGEYNQQAHLEFDNIRDFLIAHYRASKRRNSPFWAQGQSTAPPASLAHKIRLFMAHGQVAQYEEESFPDTTWAAAWLGQGQWPDHYDPMLENYDFERLTARFDQMKQIIKQAVDAMPTHAEYLEQI